MNIDPTVAGDIITHERTTWTKSSREVKRGCVEAKAASARRPPGSDAEVCVCPHVL